MPSGDAPNRPDYEFAKAKILLPDGTTIAPSETLDTKPGPTGPPESRPPAEVRRVPPWFLDIYQWLEQIAQDEGIVLDLCLERAIEIVRFNHDRGMVGIDFFPEAAPNGMGATRMNYVAVAAPLAVELYKQVLQTINQRADEFAKLVDAAQAKKREMEKAETKKRCEPPTIAST